MPAFDSPQLPFDPPLSQDAQGLPLDAFPLGITVADAQGRILQTNAAASLLLGLPVAEHLARSITGPEWKLFQADGSPAAVEALPGLRALREQRRIEEPEMGVLRPDGSVIWLTISAVPLGPDRVLITYVDVTEAKRVREALWQSEVQNRALIQAIPDLVFTNRRDGEYLAFHAKDTQGLLVPPEAFLHRHLEEVLPAPLAERFLAVFGEVLDTHAVKEVNYSLPMAGEERQFEARVVPCTEDTVVTIVRDVTERKQSEAALRESEAQLRIIFESTGAGIILVSPQGEIDYANRHMGEMFGVTDEALLGSNYTSHLHASERHRGDEQMRQLVAGEVATVAVERRYLRADGTEFWGHLAGRRLEHPDGSLRALVGIITDISQRKQAEEEQRNLQAQLNQAQKLESLGSLAGGVAHDMNNVLGAILGLASAHIEAQVPGSPTHRAFGTIIKATERGGTMLKSLLSFARQSASELRELDLNAILREEVHLLERTTLAKVHLVLDLALDLRPMQGDASALTHAFMNLCVNAVDAMPEHGTLTLRTRNLDEGWIEAQVEDTGLGMASDILEKALDPFFTTKDVGKGTGLGLSIVYSTVQAHQGKIELWSQPGQGTCVTMRFPACTTGAQDPSSSGKFQTTGSRKKLDILLVDDDELIQSSMQALLEVLGHRVFISNRGEDALAKLHAGLVPDLVILDMNMPGLGGAGTLPRLRALHPKLPVLLATGRADQAAVNLVEAHAHTTLLAKPFSMKQLQKFLEPIGR